jgi:ADP-ribose pyrophosphatase YjhB (NUDIX family)
MMQNHNTAVWHVTLTVMTLLPHQEQEACKREQATKEKEWEKLNQMEQKNLELEAAIAELERYLALWHVNFRHVCT